MMIRLSPFRRYPSHHVLPSVCHYPVHRQTRLAGDSETNCVRLAADCVRLAGNSKPAGAAGVRPGGAMTGTFRHTAPGSGSGAIDSSLAGVKRRIPEMFPFRSWSRPLIGSSCGRITGTDQTRRRSARGGERSGRYSSGSRGHRGVTGHARSLRWVTEHARTGRAVGPPRRRRAAHRDFYGDCQSSKPDSWSS